jgi:flagella basal body P-ring formation protein FlgA
MQRVPATDIVHAVELAVAERLKSTGSTARLQATGRVEDQQLPIGQLRIEVGQTTGRWPREHIAVPVRLWVDGRPIRSLTVWGEMHDIRAVSVYASDYSAHEAETAVRFANANVDMICCDGEASLGNEEMAETRLHRSVHAGQPVLHADFEPMPDVLAQQEVAIEVSRGPVRVTTTGMALGDGRIGDRIPVRPNQSNTAVSSLVVAKERVAIDE